MTKPVLITGGAKRLGAAFAREVSAHGWQVIIHYGRSQDEAEALATALSGHAVQADLADLDALPTLIDRAEELAGGPLVGLVNSASVFEHDTVSDVTPASLTRHFAINTAAPVLLSRRFAEGAGDGACIVNLLDQKLWNPNADHLSYTLAKAALREATTLCAKGLAPRIRVVGVAPGYCLPNPTESEERFEAKAGEHNAMRRRLEPTHIAQAVRFALENPAITGSVILADNGEHLLASDRDVAFR